MKLVHPLPDETLRCDISKIENLMKYPVYQSVAKVLCRRDRGIPIEIKARN